MLKKLIRNSFVSHTFLSDVVVALILIVSLTQQYIYIYSTDSLIKTEFLC